MPGDAGTTTRVSVSSSGVQTNGLSDDGAISGDGSTVAYESDATNLVTGDTNAKGDVFVRTIATGVTIRGSVTNAGAQGTSDSGDPSLNVDGHKLGFFSNAANLVTGDTNSRADIFIRDFTVGTTTRFSVADGGTQGNDTSQDPCLTADGKTVAFQSTATNLVSGDTNATSDIFVRGPGLDASTYGYDRLYRLTSVVGPDGSPAYGYDPVGNRSTKVLGGTTTSTYDRADRILTAGALSLTVNANGNTTTKGADTFAYDQANRLKTATVAGMTEAYIYDGDGTRFSRQVGAGTPIRYISDVNRGLPVTIDDGTHKYVYGLGLAYAVSGSTVEVYHTDRLGSVRAITDVTGAVTATYRTDEWGIPISTTGSSTQLFRFTGEPRDATGLSYLRSRYLDPALGRFVSRDTYVGSGTQPASLNRYVYALDNPAWFRDPSGRKSVALRCYAPRPQAGPDPNTGLSPYQGILQAVACESSGPFAITFYPDGLHILWRGVHDLLAGASAASAAAALALATSGLVGGPFSEGAAALAGAVSLATGFGATGMDCVDNIGGTDCFIGIAGTAAGLAGPIGKGLNCAFDFGEDVVRAVDWVGQVGAAGFTVGGFLNALFGGGG